MLIHFFLCMTNHHKHGSLKCVLLHDSQVFLTQKFACYTAGCSAWESHRAETTIVLIGSLVSSFKLQLLEIQFLRL